MTFKGSYYLSPLSSLPDPCLQSSPPRLDRETQEDVVLRREEQETRRDRKETENFSHSSLVHLSGNLRDVIPTNVKPQSDSPQSDEPVDTGRT